MIIKLCFPVLVWGFFLLSFWCNFLAPSKAQSRTGSSSAWDSSQAPSKIKAQSFKIFSHIQRQDSKKIPRLSNYLKSGFSLSNDPPAMTMTATITSKLHSLLFFPAILGSHGQYGVRKLGWVCRKSHFRNETNELLEQTLALILISNPAT